MLLTSSFFLSFFFFISFYIILYEYMAKSMEMNMQRWCIGCEIAMMKLYTFKWDNLNKGVSTVIIITMGTISIVIVLSKIWKNVVKFNIHQLIPILTHSSYTSSFSRECIFIFFFLSWSNSPWLIDLLWCEFKIKQSRVYFYLRDVARCNMIR